MATRTMKTAAPANEKKVRVKGLNNLTDVAIRKLKEPGLYADGGKLFLQVGSTSQKSWVLLFQWNGKPKTMGLGSLSDVGLAEARRRRLHWLAVLAAGENPLEVREREREAERAKEAAGKPLTFKQCAAEVIKVRGPSSAANQSRWLNTMQKAVGALADLEPVKITTKDVLAALKPYWHSRPAQADVLRQRMETILDWAHIKGLIPDPWSNPARLKGNLEWLLERRDHEPGHHPSLPYKQVGAYMAGLRAGDQGLEVCRQAVEFCILTATRQGAARGTRLSEIDREAKVWTVPKERNKVRNMRSGKEHRVPLSDAAMAVVDTCWAAAEENGTGFLFPTAARGGCVSGYTMNEVAVRYVGDLGAATIHGFRSTFKDWSLNVGGFTDEIGEECMAHVVGSKVRNAYRRDDNLENRRKVMAAWADFLAVEWKENVVELGSQKAA